MQLSDKRVQEFKDIYKEEHGKKKRATHIICQEVPLT